MAALTPIASPCAPVTSDDAMTVEAAELPYPVLKKCVSRIIGEVPGVNRVVYDITGKPPERSSGNDARNGENPHEYRLFCPSILLLILD